MLHYMDPASTQAIKEFISPNTQAKFAKTKPPKPAGTAKILPVRGLNPSNDDPTGKPAGQQRKNKTIPIKKVTDKR